MSEDASEALAPGTVLDKYVVVRPIGSGGMGAIYEATHSELGKRVAIKTLHAEVARNPDVRARFLREGQAATRIRHPHVVDVSDVGVSHGVPYLVMELLEGEDLANLIGREGALAPERIAEILLPVFAAVATAHEEGIVHRDLKPENIFLARTRHGAVVPKLLDFGISKVADTVGSGRALTGTNSLLGTPFYMSPEQASGGKNVDAKSDQYSLGVILYECVAGMRPFRAETLYSLLTTIVQGQFDPPSAVRPGIPAALESAILRAMRREPAERFDSVAQLAHEILAFSSVGVRATWEPVFGSARSVAPLSTAMPGRSGSPAPTPSFFNGSTLAASATELSGSSATSHRRGWTFAAVAVALVLVGIVAGVAWTSRAHPASNASRAVSPVATLPPPTSPPPTEAPVVVPAAASALPATPAPPPIVTSAPATAAAPTSNPPAHSTSDHSHHGSHSPREPAARMGVNGAPVFE